MKIAYVTIHIEPKIINGGVGNKIKSQISLWKSKGHSVVMFSLTPESITSIPEARQFTFQPSSKLPILKSLSREFSRSSALGKLIADVRKYQPDIIYFRFGLFSFPLQNLFKVAPVVLEINSNDLDEYRSRGTFFYWLNRITRDIVFSKCSGWVATSHELENLPANQKHAKPVCVISNGIELDKYEVLPPTDHSTPALALVGSPGMNWHGVDKLLELATQYPELKIHIIGYSRHDFSGVVPENIQVHGYLEREDVKHVLKKTDAVFGTLALHRKNMEEASPLKVREALAYGMPVILAYRDTDLWDMQSDRLLFLPNTPDNISANGKLIRDFAFRMQGKRLDRESIATRIDQRRKEEQRLQFLAQFAGAARS